MITSLLQKAIQSFKTTLATLFPVTQDRQHVWQPIPVPVKEPLSRRQQRQQHRYNRHYHH